MMFNKYNIKVFDYIYSINMDLSTNDYVNIEKCEKNLNNIIEQTGYTQYEFWKQNYSILLENNLYDNSTLNDTDKTKNFIYLQFPKMTLPSLLQYIDFKTEQFKKVLNSNPNYNFNIDNLKKDLNIENTLGIKEIIEKCIENKILISEGEYWSQIPGTKYGRIKGENLKVNKNFNQKEEYNKKSEVNKFYNNGIIYGNVSQINSFNNNDDDKLFDLVLDKLEAMQLESNLSMEKKEEIRTACKERKKDRVISLLKEVAKETGVSLIANSILNMFGIR